MDKIVGCDATTTCGQNVGGFNSTNCGLMATFSFTTKVTSKLESFKIVKTCMRKARNGPSSNLNLGCGKAANWKQRANVPTTPEFQESAAVQQLQQLKGWGSGSNWSQNSSGKDWKLCEECWQEHIIWKLKAPLIENLNF